MRRPGSPVLPPGGVPPSLSLPAGPGPVPGSLPGAAVDLAQGSLRFQVGPDLALLCVPDVGRFLVAGGRRVTYELVPAAPPVAVEAWLRGPVAGVARLQRRRFTLHASAVEVDGTVVAVAGHHGAGKSTAVAALARTGATVLSDDVTPVDPAGHGSPPVVTSTGRGLHLWPDSARGLGVEGSTGPGPGGKLALPLPATGPRPLHAVIGLAAGDGDEVRLRAAGDLAEAADTVRTSAYQAHLASLLWPADLHRWSVAVARTCGVWVLLRPAERWTADEVAGAVRRVARSGRPACPLWPV